MLVPYIILAYYYYNRKGYSIIASGTNRVIKGIIVFSLKLRFSIIPFILAFTT